MPFSDLPADIIVEICAYLDLFDVVSLSEANRNLRSISCNHKTFWLPAIWNSTIPLQLPCYLPLVDSQAVEIHNAAHQAVRLGKNLESSRPVLQGWKRFSWPYNDPHSLFPKNRPLETVEEMIEAHFLHPNGQWMFGVSRKNNITVLDIKHGALAGYYSNQKPPSMMFRFLKSSLRRETLSIDFQSSERPLMALVSTYERGTSAYSEFEIIQVTLVPDKSLAILDVLAIKEVDDVVGQACIAGEYLVVRSDIDTGGDIRLLNWKTSREIDLPWHLLPSQAISANRGYLISVGYLASEERSFLQVVAYPKGEDAALLLHSIEFPSYGISFSSPITIEHNWIGSGPNCIKLCYTHKIYHYIHSGILDLTLPENSHFDLPPSPVMSQTKIRTEMSTYYFQVSTFAGLRWIWAETRGESHLKIMLLAMKETDPPGSALSKRRASELELPQELEAMQVSSLDIVAASLEHRSGIVTLQRTNGELWILRY